jgi:AcrR family transcriptional regulator
MARTASVARPDELLDQVADNLSANGVAELSLRPLAKAVGSSPRVLLYYFGSKEELVARALMRLRDRQRAIYSAMKSTNLATPTEVCRAVWRHMSSPEYERAFRMSLEMFAMALRNPGRFSEFLRTSVEDWLEFLAAPLIQKGYVKSDARAHATLVMAGFRGFMLDYCASRDRARVDHAVELWLAALNSIPLAREIPLTKESGDGE